MEWMLIFFISLLVFIYLEKDAIYNFLVDLKYFKYSLKPQIDAIKRKKSLCAYCKYSVKYNNEFYCLKAAEYKLYPESVVISPFPCRELNENNNCKYFKFDWLWFIK
jgi:hypothetical protein